MDRRYARVVTRTYWLPVQNEYLHGHHVRGSRNNNYKGVDLWVREQIQRFCQCPPCQVKGACQETEIKVLPRYHYRGIPKYLPHHWHRTVLKGKVYPPSFGEKVSVGLKQYFRNEPTEAKAKRLAVARRTMLTWQDWHRRFHRRPSVPEFVMAQLLPPTIKYVGDGKLWCRMPNGKRRNPDFHVVGTNKIIELFGGWYHRHDDPRKFVAEYRKSGMRCLVIWEREVMERPTRGVPGKNVHEAVQRCMEFASE